MRYYKRIDENGVTTTVESYSHNAKVKGAIEIDEQEYNKFVASMPEPEPIPPPRDLATEIDEIKTTILDIKTKVGMK